MNDTLAVKALLSAHLDAADFDSTVRSYPRVASIGNENKRMSSHLGSLSPTVLAVAHQPRSSSTINQRSLIYVEQTLTRVDALSNPLGSTKVKISLQSNIPSDVTLAEYRAVAMQLLGALLESDAALLNSIYAGEY